MRRKFFTLCAAVSMLLCAAVCVAAPARPGVMPRLVGRLPATSTVTPVYSGDGQVLLTAGAGGVRLWDAGTLQPRRAGFDVGTARPSVSLNGDGTRVLVRGRDAVRVWDGETGRPHSPAIRHAAGFVLPVASISADGSRVLTVGRPPAGVASDLPDDRLVKVWDADTGRLLFALEHPATAISAAFGPDGRRIVSVCLDRDDEPVTARLWDGKAGAMVAGLKFAAWGANDRAVAFSDDGRRFALRGARQVAVFDADNGTHVVTVNDFDDVPQSICLNADGTRLVARAQFQSAFAWDIPRGSRTGPEMDVPDGGAAVVISPNAERVLTGDRVWHVSGGSPAPLPAAETDQQVRGGSFSRDGSRLAVRRADGSVDVYTLDPG